MGNGFQRDNLILQTTDDKGNEMKHKTSSSRCSLNYNARENRKLPNLSVKDLPVRKTDPFPAHSTRTSRACNMSWLGLQKCLSII